MVLMDIERLNELIRPFGFSSVFPVEKERILDLWMEPERYSQIKEFREMLDANGIWYTETPFTAEDSRHIFHLRQHPDGQISVRIQTIDIEKLGYFPLEQFNAVLAAAGHLPIEPISHDGGKRLQITMHNDNINKFVSFLDDYRIVYVQNPIQQSGPVMWATFDLIQRSKGFSIYRGVKPPQPPAKPTLAADENCTCLGEVNAQLYQKTPNTELAFTMMLTVPMQVRAQVAVQKRDKKKRTKPQTVTATYCPFCGHKYPNRPSMFNPPSAEEGKADERTLCGDTD